MTSKHDSNSPPPAAQASPSTDPQSPPLGGPWFWGLVVLMLLGIGLSVYLTMVHIDVKYLGKSAGGLCNMSRRVNCNVAAQSPFATVAGLPISILGLAFYASVIVGAFFAKLRSEAGRWVFPTVLILLMGSVLYSLFLGGVSGFVLRSFCPACAGLYMVNLIAMIAARNLSPYSYSEVFKVVSERFVQVLLSPGVVAVVGTFCVLVVGSSFLKDPAISAMRDSKGWIAQYSKGETIDSALLERAIDSGHSLGPKDAKVTILEFSDFECPYCARVGPRVKQLRKDFPNDTRVVFINYPLDQACNPKLTRPFHRNACDAALMAICADKQDKFWPMHDLLFSSRNLSIDKYAKDHIRTLSLDEQAFQTCLKDPATKETLQAQIQVAIDAGVRGTPGVYINGRKAGGARPYWQLKEAVTYELKP